MLGGTAPLRTRGVGVFEMDAVDWGLMGFIALQVGLQPAVVKRYGMGVDKGVQVLVENVSKFCMCCCVLPEAAADVDPFESAQLALVPSLLYTASGVLKLRGYQNTNGVTFNTMNQTKILFSSLFTFFFLGAVPTFQKLVALALVTAAACICAVGQAKQSEGSPKHSNSFVNGVVPCAAAAAISGLASVFVQSVVQNKNRNSFLYTAELALWGMLILLPSVTRSGIKTVTSAGPHGAIPAVFQAMGGIAIGLLIKRQGSVACGFSTTVGVVLSAVFDRLLTGHLPTLSDLVCLPLVICSTYLYTA